jgi:hypothetical protein
MKFGELHLQQHNKLVTTTESSDHQLIIAHQMMHTYDHCYIDVMA